MILLIILYGVGKLIVLQARQFRIQEAGVDQEGIGGVVEEGGELAETEPEVDVIEE